MTVTFGDLLDQGRAQLADAVASWDPATGNPAEVAPQLHRLLTVLARYMDDTAPCSVAESLTRTDLASWEQAAIDAAAALHLAADALGQEIPGTSEQADLLADPSAQHLAAATAAMLAGRDLLHTHQIIGPDGLTADRSEWAPVILSAQARKPLVRHVAQWAGQLAPWAAELALPRAGSPQPARAALNAVSRWLRAAAAQHADDPEAGSAPYDDLLLRAVPPVVPPSRQPPHAKETISELCGNIPVSAQRLQATVRDEAARSVWSPAATADRWRWMAAEAAMASHLSETLLRALAARARQLGMPGHNSLRNAAAAMGDARAAWHRVAARWSKITTETRVPFFRAANGAGGQSVMVPAGPAVAEAYDLVLRLGRLAWDDQGWTPATGTGTGQRAPAALAADPAGLADVVAAVHHSAAAFARVAAADLGAVEMVGRAQRFFVPTRLTPSRYNFPRPYAPAPRIMIAELKQMYRNAIDATGSAADALDRVALIMDAPSKTVALAQAATVGRRGQSGSLQWPPVPLRSGPSSAETGPIEATLLAMKITDPLQLLRAAAIDDAGASLLREAGHSQAHQGAPSGRAARGAVTDGLAGASFPHGPAEALATGASGGRRHTVPRQRAPRAPRHGRA